VYAVAVAGVLLAGRWQARRTSAAASN
jgi:hypothetical protein